MPKGYEANPAVAPRSVHVAEKNLLAIVTVAALNKARVAESRIPPGSETEPGGGLELLW
jgi:hypothetical protein